MDPRGVQSSASRDQGRVRRCTERGARRGDVAGTDAIVPHAAVTEASRRRKVRRQDADALQGLEQSQTAHGQGSSAYQAVAARGLALEVSKALGKTAVCILWDVRKYFDSVNITELTARAEAAQYPPLDLATALQMHTVPRVLQHQQCLSEGTAVTTSLLAGCSQSVPLTKAYLNDDTQQQQQQEGVQTTTYIDDVGSFGSGAPGRAMAATAQAAVRFDQTLRRAYLWPAGRSILLATSRQLAYRIQQRLAKLGIEVQVGQSARDLGVTLNLGKKRVACTAAVRLKIGKQRLARVLSLTEASKRARRLAATSGLAKAMWGQSCISPTELEKLRTATAAATGINQAGRCRTAAIAVALGGHKHDPAVKIAKDTVTSWLSLWRQTRAQRPDARAAWKIIHGNLHAGGSLRWGRA